MKILGLGVLLSAIIFGFGCKISVPTNPKGDATVKTSKPSAVRKSSVPEPDRVVDPKVTEQRIEALARYATGITYELNEKGDDALGEFYRSALANPSNEPLVIELANRFSQKKQYDKAIEVLKKSGDRRDSSGLAFAMLAQVYLRAGKTNSALQAAQIAVTRSPSALPPYDALAQVYLSSGKTQEALKALDRAAVQIEPEPLSLIGLAELYSQYAKLHPKEKAAIAPRAKDLLDRAAKLNPDGILLQQKLADTLAYFGEPKRAADIYVKLLNDNPDADVWKDILRERLANIYLSSNDKTNAAQQLEGIIRDNPTKYPHAYYILGTIAYDQKNFERASEYFEKAILLSPQLERAYYDLAGSLLNLNQENKALGTLEKARKKFKETFVGEFFTAVAYNKLKNPAEALKHYTAAEVIAKATDTNHLDQSFYFQVGACYERNKNFLEAEKYFEKALQLSPNDPETLNYLGYMWAENGTNLAKAKQLIEKAVKLEPKNAAYLDSLGWVFFKLKEPQHALPYILKAIELSQEPDAAVYDHLGDIYQALSQPDKARDAWKKSLSIETNDDVKKKLNQTL